jgi:aconitate hydratase
MMNQLVMNYQVKDFMRKIRFQAPAEDGSNVQLVVLLHQRRLQLLEPFKPWNGENITELEIINKAFGKCTTDHISMAGPWLRFPRTF